MSPRRTRVVWQVLSQEYRRRASSGAFFASTLFGTIIVIFLASLPSLAPTLQRNGIIGANRTAVSLTGPASLRASATALIESSKTMRIVAERNERKDPDAANDLKKTGAVGDIRLIQRGKSLSLVVTTSDESGWQNRLRPLLPLAASVANGDSVAHEDAVIRLPYSFQSTLPKSSMSSRARSTEQAIASILLGALYGVVLVGSQMIMGGISEEKTNRVAEMLAAITNPRDLLSGKVLAAGALAITQAAFWVVGGVSAYLYTSRALIAELSNGAHDAKTAATALPPIEATIATIATFLILAPLAYLQFASMYAGSAALVSRPEDVSMLAAPLALPVGGSALAGIWAASHPTDPFAIIASYAPFTSAFAMTARVGAGGVEPWEIAVAVAMQFAFTAIFLEAAARIYRIGLTLYGKFPSPIQIFTMLKNA